MGVFMETDLISVVDVGIIIVYVAILFWNHLV